MILRATVIALGLVACHGSSRTTAVDAAPGDASAIDANGVACSACAARGWDTARTPWPSHDRAVDGGYFPVVGDVNGDGVPDVVFTNENSFGLAVLIGRGDASFAPRVIYGQGLSLPAIADVDRDGHADLLAVSFAVSGGVSLLRGNGDGTFQAPVTVAAGGFGALAVGDVTGDGVPDLVVGTMDVEVCTGHVDGTFDPPIAITTGGTTGVAAIALGDVDGDGATDIVAAAGAGVRVSFGDGHGAWRPEVDAPIPMPYLARMAPALVDLTGDGKPELILGNEVLTGDGAGGFGTPIDIGATGDLAIAAADFDGDIHPDLVVGSTSSLQIMLNSGTGTFHAGPVSTSVPLGLANAVVAADLDRDGRADIVAGNEDVVAVIRGNGDGTLDVPAHLDLPIGTGPAYTADVATADLDRDGTPDIVTLGAADGQNTVHVLRGGCTGTAASEDYPVGPAWSLLIADVDHDGLPDIVTDRPSVMHNRGDGTFTAPAGPIAGSARPSGLAVSDLDGDGILDVLTVVVDSNTSPTGIGIAFGNGSSARVATNGAYAFAAGDVDEDGKADLVTAAAILRGNGDGTFQSPSAGPPGSFAGMALADLDGDGHLDLVTESFTGVTQVQLGAGNGTFGAPTSYGTATGLHIVDVDGDGRLDILGTGEVGQVTLLTNTGHGGFSETDIFGIDTTAGVAVTPPVGQARGDLIVASELGVSVLAPACPM